MVRRLALVLLATVSCVTSEQTSRPALQTRRAQLLAAATAAPAGKATAHDVFVAMEDEGAKRCDERPYKLLIKSIAAGVCVGLGGILCSGIGGDLGGNFWDRSHGLDRFIFGAVGYPLSITLVTATASSAFTGNLALVGAALRAGKCSYEGAARMLAITYAGCFIGTVACGALSAISGLPGAAASVGISAHKLALPALQMFARGIGGGLLISLAIFMCTTAVKREGNIADIAIAAWLPISAYVASDFEHCLANFFFFAAGRFSGEGAVEAGLTLGPMIKEIFFSTLGNIVGAGLLGGAALSYANGPDTK